MHFIGLPLLTCLMLGHPCMQLMQLARDRWTLDGPPRMQGARSLTMAMQTCFTVRKTSCMPHNACMQQASIRNQLEVLEFHFEAGGSETECTCRGSSP